MLRGIPAVVVAVFVWAATAKATVDPPHVKLWLCIHRQERSSWTDRGWPFWGGLQFGSWFLATYPHPRGMPHQWSPRIQMWVAENAFRREHYSTLWLRSQWPPSRGVCF